MSHAVDDLLNQADEANQEGTEEAGNNTAMDTDGSGTMVSHLSLPDC